MQMRSPPDNNGNPNSRALPSDSSTGITICNFKSLPQSISLRTILTAGQPSYRHAQPAAAKREARILS